MAALGDAERETGRVGHDSARVALHLVTIVIAKADAPLLREAGRIIGADAVVRGDRGHGLRARSRQRSNSDGEMPTALQASRTACFSSGSKLPSAPPMMMPTWITARAASGLLLSLPIVAIASTFPKS